MTGGSAAILLDRDGTIIVDRDYLHDPDQVTFESNAVSGLRLLAGLDMPLVVVTNQSGVGRGYFDREAVDRVNARLATMIGEQGVTIAGWYVCPHAPDAGCDCRKPNPGMANQAANDLGLDLGRSWVIGDKRADVGLAEAVGSRGVLLLTGQGAEDRSWAEGAGHPVCADLLEAATLIGTQAGSRNGR